MKNFLKILVLVFAITAVSLLSTNMKTQEIVEAFNTDASYITIKNNTPFELEDVSVTYNTDQTFEIGKIRTGSSEKAEILPDDRRITEVTITGKFFNGKNFSRKFRGIINNDTLLTVTMNEDFSLSVNSNIDDFDD